MNEPTTIRVSHRFQGPTGFGQGGWASCRLSQAVGRQVTVAIRAPIPLDVDMTINQVSEQTSDRGIGRTNGDDEPDRLRWDLIDPGGQTVLQATAMAGDFPDTEPVSVADAEAAKGRFMLPGDLHPVPHCFACGLQPDTMAVHAGPLGDGRFATSWTVPAWSTGNGDDGRADDGRADDGRADDAVAWGALDCTAAMYVGCDGGIRTPLTVQFAVEILEPFAIGDTYALVAWPGRWDHDGWDGRKRGAASAAFDRDGTCVARSTSFWVAMD